jgi:GMC oxidoreductase
MTQAVFDMIQLFAKEPGLKIVFGPGGASHPNLNPNSLADMRQYITGPAPVDGVYFNRLIINHYGGTVALSDGAGGVDPATFIVRGTSNVAVVDASLIPTIVPAHPVGTIMAIADRAGDILAARWRERRDGNIHEGQGWPPAFHHRARGQRRLLVYRVHAEGRRLGAGLQESLQAQISRLPATRGERRRCLVSNRDGA